MATEYNYKPTKPTDPKVLRLEVVRTAPITPNMLRVTFGGPGLADLTELGHDQWFRLFLPREGQDVLRLPSATSMLWYAQYLMTPRDKRPLVRNYTVRAIRDLAGGGRELDVDFVLHDSSAGPGATWAASAKPGDAVGLLDQGLSYEPGRTPAWRLLVVDETGLPAAARIVEGWPADAAGRVYIEVPTDADRQPIAAPAGVEVHWVARGDDHRIPGELLLERVTADAAAFPTESVYAFAAGEQKLPTGLRRLLVGHGWDKADIGFIGYWRHGAGYMA